MTPDWCRRRSLLAICLAGLLALLVVACGDDDDDEASGSAGSGSSAATSNDAGLAEAQKSVDAHIQPPPSIGPTKPIEKAIPKGKKLVFVDCGQVACTNQGKALAEAAKVLGWSVDFVVAKQPTPEVVQAAFDEAIRRKPDGVASAGFSRSLYPNQLDKLNELGIPVFSSTGLEPTGEGGTTFNVQPPSEASRATSLLADKTVVDMGGEGTIGVVYLTGFPLPKIYTDAYVDRVKEVCPKCKTESIEIEPAAIGKDAPTQIANFLRRNPDIKHLMLSYDPLALGLPAAVQSVGLDQPKTYSYSPDAPGIEALQTGERAAAVPQDYNVIGWQWADAFARLFTGGDVADSQRFPPEWVVWSKDYDNVPDDTSNPLILKGYQEQFKKLWGVQ